MDLGSGRMAYPRYPLGITNRLKKEALGVSLSIRIFPIEACHEIAKSTETAGLMKRKARSEGIPERRLELFGTSRAVSHDCS